MFVLRPALLQIYTDAPLTSSFSANHSSKIYLRILGYRLSGNSVLIWYTFIRLFGPLRFYSIGHDNVGCWVQACHSYSWHQCASQTIGPHPAFPDATFYSLWFVTSKDLLAATWNYTTFTKLPMTSIPVISRLKIYHFYANEPRRYRSKIDCSSTGEAKVKLSF